MTAERRPRARPDVVLRKLADDEWALFDPVTSRVHGLNLSAALIWHACDGTRSVDDIAADVRDAFGAAPASVAADVAEALGRFDAEGLLQWT